jgi:hypothetical protein
MGKHDDLVKVYVDALDRTCSLAIVAGPDETAGICPGPAAEAVVETLWFSKPQHAEMVLAQCPEGWAKLSPAALRDEAINAAAALGARFRTAAEILAEASNVVEEIIVQVENRRQNGDLARVNRDYKVYRQTQVARGEKAVSYSAFLASFTRSLVLLAAKNSGSF